ncbi:MAG: putative metal-binding motif-containing protein [Myxococcota bacterium]
MALLWVGGCAAEWELSDGDDDGATWVDGDCDDADPNVGPNIEEVCDGVDNDCDGVIDEFDASDAKEWYVDVDGDGVVGREPYPQRACEQPDERFSPVPGDDCQDEADGAGIYPGADEICDDVDNDCDGLIDESGAAGELTWADDFDGDGFGSCDVTVDACAPPEGFIRAAPEQCDCDDTDEAVFPGATELPDDGVINDCDAR